MTRNDFYLPDGCDWIYVVLDCSPPTFSPPDVSDSDIGIELKFPGLIYSLLPLPIGCGDFDIRGITEYTDGHFETFLNHEPYG